MVWRLLVKWKIVQSSPKKSSFVSNSSESQNRRGLVIESIRVIQNAQGWTSRALEEDDNSSLTVRTLPEPSILNLDIQDCLFNPAEFKTLEEQDRVSTLVLTRMTSAYLHRTHNPNPNPCSTFSLAQHFQERMIAMADENDEGWKYFGKTSQDRPLEVFSRKVDW